MTTNQIKSMIPEPDEIEQAAERAAEMQNRASENGSKYSNMTYEDGLRDALDWVTGNADEDPTKP